MNWLLSLMIPNWLKALGAGLAGAAGIGVLAFFKGRNSGEARENLADRTAIANTISKEQGIATQVASVTTVTEADRALDALAPDHK